LTSLELFVGYIIQEGAIITTKGFTLKKSFVGLSSSCKWLES